MMKFLFRILNAEFVHILFLRHAAERFFGAEDIRLCRADNHFYRGEKWR